jgi:hypothetical protein
MKQVKLQLCDDGTAVLFVEFPDGSVRGRLVSHRRSSHRHSTTTNND